MAKTTLRAESKVKIAKQVFRGGFSVLRSFASHVPEKVVEELGDEDVSRFITDICNCQEPNRSLFSLIRLLRNQKFQVYLLSNIGGKFFQDLRTKCEPGLFSDFEGFSCTGPDDGYAKKPKPEAFQRFQRQFNPDSQFRVIFVDDHKKNVEASIDAGFVGIQFQSTKKLKRQLGLAGIVFEDSSPMLLTSACCHCEHGAGHHCHHSRGGHYLHTTRNHTRLRL
mmetsp:Transcript_49262/g.115726  ORF Transcript_49262/g.115726 Transcript_49262/m.115726 type:complete len:223 (+) Transcript_49262:120-788(+)